MTWTNPPYNDFSHIMVYLNGIWGTNTSDAYYTATNLNPDTTYELSTHTVDTHGNVIPLQGVNPTAKTSLPATNDASVAQSPMPPVRNLNHRRNN